VRGEGAREDGPELEIRGSDMKKRGPHHQGTKNTTSEEGILSQRRQDAKKGKKRKIESDVEK
jgi:hypothetical protein